MHNRQGLWAYQNIQNKDSITLWFSDRFVRKNEVVYRDRGYFETKSKGYDSTMKRTVKRTYYGMIDISKKEN